MLSTIPSIWFLLETPLDSIIISNSKSLLKTPNKNVCRTLLHKSYFLYFIFKALFVDRICMRVSLIFQYVISICHQYFHIWLPCQFFIFNVSLKLSKKKAETFHHSKWSFCVFLLFLACNWNFQLFQHPFFKEFLFCGWINLKGVKDEKNKKRGT